MQSETKAAIFQSKHPPPQPRLRNLRRKGSQWRAFLSSSFYLFFYLITVLLAPPSLSTPSPPPRASEQGKRLNPGPRGLSGVLSARLCPEQSHSLMPWCFCDGDPIRGSLMGLSLCWLFALSSGLLAVHTPRIPLVGGLTLPVEAFQALGDASLCC